jgi:hypothetical protein
MVIPIVINSQCDNSIPYDYTPHLAALKSLLDELPNLRVLEFIHPSDSYFITNVLSTFCPCPVTLRILTEDFFRDSHLYRLFVGGKRGAFGWGNRYEQKGF